MLNSLHVFTGHNYIGTEHLLLGLLREHEGVAAKVLGSLGADPKNIRTQASYMVLFSLDTLTCIDSLYKYYYFSM